MSDVTFSTCWNMLKNFLPYWQKLDDVCEGEDAVKAKVQKYFCRCQMHMISHLQIKALMRLILLVQSFCEVTGTTSNSLVGAAFATDPSFKFPPWTLLILERNANGAGLVLINWLKMEFATY